MLEQRRIGVVRRICDHGPSQLTAARAMARLRRLRHEIVLGGEVAVKAAMGEVGRLHDVGDADAAKALGAEQCAGRIDDAVAVSGGFSRLTLIAPQLCGSQQGGQQLDKLYDDRHQ